MWDSHVKTDVDNRSGLQSQLYGWRGPRSCVRLCTHRSIGTLEVSTAAHPNTGALTPGFNAARGEAVFHPQKLPGCVPS